MYSRYGIMTWVLAAACVLGCSKDTSKGSEQGGAAGDPAAAGKAGKQGTSADGDAKASDVKTGDGPWYRAALTLEDGYEIAFFLSIPPPGANARSMVVSGEERITVDTKWSGDEVALHWPAYETRIRARRAPDGTLTGQWQRQSTAWGRTELPFRATSVEAPDVAALFPRQKPAGDGDGDAGSAFAGVWQFEFSDGQSGRVTIADRGSGTVTVSIQIETSDTADMVVSGVSEGRSLRASSFDGNFAYLMAIDLDEGGRKLRGRWFIGGLGAYTVTGKRNEEFTMPPVVAVGDAAARLDLAEEATYAGKPLLVDVAGSWCPPCQRSAPFLKALYDTYHERGLEFVTLLYEFTSETETDARRAEAFKRDHDIPWEVRPVTVSLEDFASTLPSELALTVDNIRNLPLILFLNAKGRVAFVHTGFVGPELPEEHERLKATFHEQIKKLLPKSKK